MFWFMIFLFVVFGFGGLLFWRPRRIFRRRPYPRRPLRMMSRPLPRYRRFRRW